MTSRFVVVSLLTFALSLGAVEKKVIAPKGTDPNRPYSMGLKVGDTVYVSGMTGTDPKTGKLPADFKAEVKQTLDNIGVILKEAGYDYSDAVSVQVYLTDVDMFQQMNEVYMSVFKQPRPTRTTVGVTKLIGGAHIEITVTARK